MATYALENRISGDYSSLFVHEVEDAAHKAELFAHVEAVGNKIRRISRDEAKDYVRRGITHSTRFWVDGGTVRG